MIFTRRALFAAAAGAPLLGGARRKSVTLDAISGAQLPHRLTIPAFPEHPAAYFELREYRAAEEGALDRLHRAFVSESFASIRPLLWKRGRTLHYLIPFESLGARADAWTLFASHPSWVGLRGSVYVSAVSVYCMPDDA